MNVTRSQVFKVLSDNHTVNPNKVVVLLEKAGVVFADEPAPRDVGKELARDRIKLNGFGDCIARFAGNFAGSYIKTMTLLDRENAVSNLRIAMAEAVNFALDEHTKQSMGKIRRLDLEKVADELLRIPGLPDRQGQLLTIEVGGRRPAGYSRESLISWLERIVKDEKYYLKAE